MLYKGFSRLGSMWTNETRNEENRMFKELFGVTDSFQQQLDNLVLSGGDSPDEVVQARGEYNLLYKRLDAVDFSLGVISGSKADKSITDKLKERIDKIDYNYEGVTIDDIQYPLVVAHRGSRNIYPESSIEALKFASDDGYVIEFDVHLTGDGTAVVTHDADIGRITDLTGDVKHFSTPGFLNAKVNELGTSFIGHTTTLENVLRTLGNKTLYAIEAKGPNTADEIIRLVNKYRLKNNVIAQAFNLNNAKKFANEGFKTLYLQGSGVDNPATIKKAGIDIIGMGKNVSKSVITQHKNAGLEVWLYTINEKQESIDAFEKGADAIFSDDVKWVDGTAQVLPRDNFVQHTYYHGQTCPPKGYKGSAVQGNRGEFSSVGKFGWSKAINLDGVGLEAKRDFTLQGWAGELYTNFELKGSIYFDGRTYQGETASGYASIVICAPNEIFDDYSSESSGYNIVFWSNGTMRLYEVNEGEATSGGDNTGNTSFEEGEKIDFTLTVSGDKIKLERDDSNFKGVAFEDTNSKYRNGFLHLGRSNIGANFGNLKYRKL